MTTTEQPAGSTEVATRPDRDKCVIDVHPNLFDLRAEMTTKFYNKTDPKEPVHFLHADQTLLIRVTVVLYGRIVNYLCGTELCVCVAFESCGSGPEGEECRSIKLDPCKTRTYEIEIELPGNKLPSGDCGKNYEICITLGSKDCCGKPGFIFGRCKHFDLTVLPADVSGTPVP